MEEALKRMAFKPNLKEINERSTFSKRIRASLNYNRFTKSYLAMKSSLKGPTVIEIGEAVSKSHNWTLMFGAVILGLGFYSSVLVTKIRKETFERNYALIEKKYGE